jgi:signal transduction histidine kinase
MAEAAPVLIDWAIAAVVAALDMLARLTAVPLLSIGGSALRVGQEPEPVMLSLALVGGAALVVRRRAPVTVLLLTTVTTCAALMLDFPPVRPLALIVALFTVALRSSTVITAVAGVLLALCLNLAVVAGRGGWQEDLDDRVTDNLMVIGLSCLLGWGIQLGRARTTALREQAARLTREHAAARERALQEERSRIARELHDVVAHHVSVITAQAAGAGRVFDAEPERARQALAAIETTGRGAMTELRRLLGLLQPTQRDAALDPPPTLAQLPSLVSRVERTGLPVQVSVSGTPIPLPPGMELNAYRIVQEALTNAVKHADASRAWVDLAYAPQELTIRVRDDGRGLRRTPTVGRGLLGMKERTGLHRGDLAVGPGPEGGVEVVARLPLEQGAGEARSVTTVPEGPERVGVR